MQLIHVFQCIFDTIKYRFVRTYKILLLVNYLEKANFVKYDGFQFNFRQKAKFYHIRIDNASRNLKKKIF